MQKKKKKKSKLTIQIRIESLRFEKRGRFLRFRSERKNSTYSSNKCQPVKSSSQNFGMSCEMIVPARNYNT